MYTMCKVMFDLSLQSRRLAQTEINPGSVPPSCCWVLHVFVFAGTLIGCAPNNFMAANAGDHLSELDSLADLYNPRMLLLGLTVGSVALLPVYLKHRHERGMAMLTQKLR